MVFEIYVSEAGFSGNPGTVTVHENEDDVVDLWTITTNCTVDCSYLYTCSYGCGEKTCYRTCTMPCTTTVTCNQCHLTINPSNLFQTSGRTVQKKGCSTPGCGPTCSATGCTNAGETFTVGVGCWRTGYNTNGYITDSFTVSISQNAAPTFYFSKGNSIDVYKASSSTGSVVNTMVASDIDAYIDGDTIVYRLDTPPRPSWIHGNILFDLNTENGTIYVTQSLNYEFSYDYTMRVCVHDRREDETCHTLSITLHACFQTPNCTNKENHKISDTFGTHTGHGDTNILFEMTSPDPSDHFPDFHSGWHELQWTFDSNDMAVADIDYYTGVIKTTANISIFPAWPNKSFSMRVRVGNSESCYTTTCDIAMTVWYTNWDIDIRSLPESVYVPENNDTEFLVHRLYTYDYNYAEEDNATCYIVSITPNVSNLFELRDDGLHNFDSYSLYRLACQTPDCGYKYSTSALGAFFCDLDLGCLNNDIHDNYEILIRCADAYGSSDEDVFTFNVLKNQAPIWLNLNNTIVMTEEDVLNAANNVMTVFTIKYSDAENDSLKFEYTITPDSGYFEGTMTGYSIDNPANITANIRKFTDGNATFMVHIIGYERRNEINGFLRINLTSLTYPEISNLPATVSLLENTTIGTSIYRLDVTDQGEGDVHTYILTDIKPASANTTFSIDKSDGQLTLSSELDYEKLVSYWLTFVVEDELLRSQTEKVLTVNVLDINETPSFDVSNITLRFTERTAVGAVFDDVINTCTDPDIQDTVSYSISSGIYTDFFGIDSTSGLLYLTRTWDLESGLPSSTKFVVTCTDSGGMTSTVDVNVFIQDVNEFPPVLSVSLPDSANPGSTPDSIIILRNTSFDEDLLIFNVTDNDWNNKIIFRITGSDVAKSHFTIVESQTDEHLNGTFSTAKLRLVRSMDASTHFILTVQVSDGELETDYQITVSVSGQLPKNDADSMSQMVMVNVITVVLVGLLVGLSILGIYCYREKRRKPKSNELLLNDLNQPKPAINEISESDSVDANIANKRKPRIEMEAGSDCADDIKIIYRPTHQDNK